MVLFHTNMRISTSKGVMLIEVMVSLAVIVLLVSTGYQAYLSSNKLNILSDHTSIARSLAEEGIEATRSIRDQNFSLLTAGTKGLALVSNTWQFLGAGDATSSGPVTYFRTVTLSTVDASTVRASSTVSWLESNGTNTISVSSLLTNWHKSVGMTDTLTINTTSANLSAADSSRLLTGISLVSDGSYGTTTITKITITYSGVVNTRRLQQINSPNGTSIWTGSSASAVVNTLTTPLNLVGSVTQSIEFRFNSTMAGATITVGLTFSDNSTKSATVTNPPTGP
jgi:hypothetical protein